MQNKNMNQEDIQQQIKEQFRSLPPLLQEAITATDLPIKMKDLANKHNLLLDEAGILEMEILFVLLGMKKSSDFVSTLASELKLDKHEVTSIAQDVNTFIFEVRTHLREIEQETEDEGDKGTAPSSSATSVNFDTLKRDMEAVGGIAIHNESSEPEEYTYNSMGKPASTHEPHIEPPTNLPGKTEIVGMTDAHTEALPDHLLGKPAVTPIAHKPIINQTFPTSSTQPSVSVRPTQPVQPIPPMPREGGSIGDHYREPV
jgi:hypothetical protein